MLIFPFSPGGALLLMKTDEMAEPPPNTYPPPEVNMPILWGNRIEL